MFYIIHIIIIILLIPTISMSASFNCDGKLTKIESIVCTDINISKMDSELGIKYNIALILDNGVAISQMKWLKNRNNCKDVDCLESIYKERIVELDLIISNYYNIEPFYDNAAFLEGWKPSSSMGIGLTCMEKSRRLSMLLEKQHEILKYKLLKIDVDNKYIIELITEVYNSWNKLLIYECGLIFRGEGQGSFQQACISNMLRDRYIETIDVLICIDNVGTKDKEYEQAKCLEKIITLNKILEYLPDK